MKEIQQKNRRKIISYIMVIVFLIIMVWLIVQESKNIKDKKQKISDLQYNVQNISTTNDYQKSNDEGINSNSSNNNGNTNDNNNITNDDNSDTHEKSFEEQTEQNSKNGILNEYKGYKVIAKLEIPKINLETYVLEQYSTAALNVSVTKFWGAEPNKIGNFCVAGHNFQNKNMFHNLKKVEKGDRLTISDNNIGKIEYEVYDTFKVKPEEVSCLSQKTNGKREVTLITCTLDSAKRIIVKAREIN